MIPIWWSDIFINANQKNMLQVLELPESRFIINQVGNNYGTGLIGPFGGLYSEETIVSGKDVMDIVEAINELKITQFTFRLPTESQFSNLHKINRQLLTNFEVKNQYVDLNQEIDLKRHININRNRKRDLLKAEKENVIFSECEIDDVYDLLQRNRLGLGVNFGLTRQTIEVINRERAGTIKSFRASIDEKIFVGAFVFEVSENISHVYAWGHDPAIPDSRKFMTFFAIQLINYYKDIGKKILCLGTSSKGGVVNPGLARFKSELGAYASEREVYETR